MAQVNLNLDLNEIIDKDIFTLLHLEKAPKEKKDAIMTDMIDTVRTRVSARILESLSEPEISTLEMLIDQKHEDKVEEFLENKGINLMQVTSEEAMKYKAEIVKLIKTKEES